MGCHGTGSWGFVERLWTVGMRMQPGSIHGGLERVIHALRQVAVACAVLGSCLLLGAFVLIPILGFVSADIGAVGIWCLLLGALTACLLLVAAVVNRARSGYWYFGEQDLVLRIVTSHGGAVIRVLLIILILVLLTLGWLNMH
jgi:hypothetical protein